MTTPDDDERQDVLDERQRSLRGSESRHLVTVSILVSTIFSLLLGVGVGLVGTKAYSASRDAKAAAQQNAATLHENCLSSNRSRALQVQLWEYILTLNPNPTPEQKATSDKLISFVRTNYAQQDCQ